jgi:hypothetical protein
LSFIHILNLLSFPDLIKTLSVPLFILRQHIAIFPLLEHLFFKLEFFLGSRFFDCISQVFVASRYLVLVLDHVLDFLAVIFMAFEFHLLLNIMAVVNLLLSRHRNLYRTLDSLSCCYEGTDILQLINRRFPRFLVILHNFLHVFVVELRFLFLDFFLL